MFKKVFIGIPIFLLALIVGVWLFLYSSKPQYDGELILEGLNREVKVYYDTYGIPHIYAENEADLYFALGYVHAQDRLFQMELLRRVGGGNLSEILGPELIETDRFLRTIGINETAKASVKAYFSSNHEPFQKAALAYLQGINKYQETGKTPPEFTLLGIQKRDFTPIDLYRIIGYMGFSFNTAIRSDPLITSIASELGPTYLNDLVLNTTAENTTIPTFLKDSSNLTGISTTAMNVLKSLPVPAWMGSNSWVVGPQKTRSGYPMLANDTHIGFGQPAVFYEAHLNSPGFNFYGNHIAGFPFALIGHNDFNAWGLTIFPNDDMDFYREKSNPDNLEQVWNRDHWDNLQVRKETIAVKGEEDIEFQVSTSRHGPIINQVNALVDSVEEAPISFFWTFNKFPNKALQVAYGLAHSRSIDQFQSAVSMLEAPGLNFTYADKDGNIAWWAAAKLIKRPDHVASKMILDGASGKDDPLGWYPFSENPRSVNPESGYVYSANNQPDSMYGTFHTGYYYPGARAKKITSLLSASNGWNMAKFQQMVTHDQSPDFPEIAKSITSRVSGDLSEVEQSVLDLVNSWDGKHGLKDPGPTIYYQLTYHLQKNMMEDELGEDQFKLYLTTLIARRSLPYLIKNEKSIWWNNMNTPELENADLIINMSFRETIKVLTDALGNNPDQWTWDRVHLVEHSHAIGRRKPFNLLFNVGPFPVSGGDEVINKMDFNKSDFPYKVHSGAAMRILIDLADIENSLSILPTGQSGHVMSPHYKNQSKRYLNGEFRPQHMDKHKIILESKDVLLLLPAKPKATDP